MSRISVERLNSIAIASSILVTPPTLGASNNRETWKRDGDCPSRCDQPVTVTWRNKVQKLVPSCGLCLRVFLSNFFPTFTGSQNTGLFNYLKIMMGYWVNEELCLSQQFSWKTQRNTRGPSPFGWRLSGICGIWQALQHHHWSVSAVLRFVITLCNHHISFLSVLNINIYTNDTGGWVGLCCFFYILGLGEPTNKIYIPCRMPDAGCPCTLLTTRRPPPHDSWGWFKAWPRCASYEDALTLTLWAQDFAPIVGFNDTLSDEEEDPLPSLFNHQVFWGLVNAMCGCAGSVLYTFPSKKGSIWRCSIWLETLQFWYTPITIE